MIGKRAEVVLNRAIRYAVESQHELFTLEHLLWSLLKDSKVKACVHACGGDPEVMRLALEASIAQDTPRIAGGDVAEARPGKGSPQSPSSGDPDADAPDASGSDDDSADDTGAHAGEHPLPTLGIQRLVQRAIFQVQSSGRDQVLPEDLLVALFQAKDSQALYVLQQQGMQRIDVLNYVSHGTGKDGLESGDAAEGEGAESAAGDETGERGESAKAESPLALYAQNLNERAKLGKLDPLIGRELELERMVQTLCRRRKNNPLLVGEAGVGKTALAEGLALRITEGKVPQPLAQAVVYSLDLGALMAGTRYRGDFEARVKKVIQAIQRKKEHGEDPILFIDEIHTLIGAGAVGGGALDAANLFKPLLSRGEIRCIGSTTYAEYRSHIEKDHALSRRFQRIEVLEPSQEETISILQGLKTRLEDHHHVVYAQDALRAAVELSAKHLTDRFLPDKAIDVLDEAGARERLKRIAKDVAAGGKESAGGRPTLTAAAIEEVIAQIARIPAKNVTVSQKQRLKNLERDLKLTIFGQDAAIDALVTAIRLARSGLRTGERPIGSFLLCGPTGVGKTELTKQLALSMGVPFLRYDMSEYGEKHTVSRLIGAPPGYVGFEQAGLLTDAILKNPHSVILLDEIEKAHPDIWNILLQVMDHGVLTDNNGRKADFRNAFVILTSNVGSREMEKKPLGMIAEAGAEQEAAAARASAKGAVERVFSPEFRNRLDAIVFFNPLSPDMMAQIVSKQLVELETQALAKGVEIEVTDALRDHLARKGYDRSLGARPLARVIQDEIKKGLANEILFGKLEHGGRALVDFRDGKVVFEVTAKVPAGGGGSAAVRKSESVES